MRTISLGEGNVSVWTAVENGTNIPYIAFADGDYVGAEEFPEHTVKIEYRTVENLNFHIDRLTEFRNYLLELEQYYKELGAYNKQQEENNGEV